MSERFQAEPSLQWRKSSFSMSNGHCVEVAPQASGIAVRDSKKPEGSRLHFSPKTWEVFTASVKTTGRPLTGGQR